MKVMERGDSFWITVSDDGVLHSIVFQASLRAGLFMISLQLWIFTSSITLKAIE